MFLGMNSKALHKASLFLFFFSFSVSLFFFSSFPEWGLSMIETESLEGQVCLETINSSS